MDLASARTGLLEAAPVSANDRLKRSWDAWLVRSLVLAVVVHAGVFALWPEVDLSVTREQRDEPARLMTLAATVPVVLPPSPIAGATVAEAALPVEHFELDLDIGLDLDVPLPTFDDLSIGTPPELPALALEEGAWLPFDDFAPYLVRPEVRNRGEMKRFLERYYQTILDASGATGVVHVSFWIDENGQVQKAEIAKSSGSRSLDRLAMRLSRVLHFRPALFAGRPVRVQVRLPITFRAVAA